jgi:hypothetical protein
MWRWVTCLWDEILSAVCLRLRAEQAFFPASFH